MSEELKQLYSFIEAASEEATEIARQIWLNAEPAYKETFACEYLCKAFEEKGFTVERGCAGMPTAFRAVYGSGKPVIGILTEYDALPGLSQAVSTRKEPIPGQAAGHGCGHNLQAGAAYATVMGLKEMLDKNNLPGTLVVYGCPAEEVITGKVFMAREGAFRELDAAFSWHSASSNIVSDGFNTTAVDNIEFHFHGKAAHAGMAWMGRSASDAAELTAVGSNYLREHVQSNVWMHYTIDNTGNVPNIVADKSRIWYYVRSTDRKNVSAATERLKDVARGAAIMTGTELEIKFNGGCCSSAQSKALGDLTEEVVKEIPAPVWSEEELAFAAELNRVADEEKGIAPAADPNPALTNDWMRPTILCGSTDIADVSQIVPLILIQNTGYNTKAALHSWQITACSGHSIGFKSMMYGAQIMGAASLRLILEPERMAKVRKEFDEVHKDPYICPIPADVKIPE